MTGARARHAGRGGARGLSFGRGGGAERGGASWGAAGPAAAVRRLGHDCRAAAGRRGRSRRPPRLGRRRGRRGAAGRAAGRACGWAGRAAAGVPRAWGPPGAAGRAAGQTGEGRPRWGGCCLFLSPPEGCCPGGRGGPRSPGETGPHTAGSPAPPPAAAPGPCARHSWALGRGLRTGPPAVGRGDGGQRAGPGPRAPEEAPGCPGTLAPTPPRPPSPARCPGTVGALGRGCERVWK